MLGKSRHPQIWMVTGIELIADVSARNEGNTSSNQSLNVQPPVEMITAVSSLLGSEGSVGGSISKTGTKKITVEYDHKDERIWAAQFRRLKVEFIQQNKLPLGQDILLDDLVDLGHGGMKSAGLEVDEIGDIAFEDDSYEEDLPMTEEDKIVFDKLSKALGKRALLIGGIEHGLKGIRNDLTTMADLLLDRGFDITLCYGEDATRQGVIATWLQFMAETSEGDVVVVYYSGHGGYRESKESDRFRTQYILPADISETKKGDFHGILDVEISRLVTALTDKTHNVTIVLDCCHSELVARDEELPPLTKARAWCPLSATDLDEHKSRLQEKGFMKSGFYKEGNPYAVRIVAAEGNRPAFETPGSDDKVMGKLTRALASIIKKAGQNRLSWDAVLPTLRRQLGYPTSSSQRPQIEGPITRALFSLDELDYWGQLGLLQMKTKDKFVLMGGLLAGVREGDTYAIMPSAASSLDPETQIGTATVEAVFASRSDTSLKLLPTHHEVPEGARAFPLQRHRPEHSVRLDIKNIALSQRLHKQLERAKFVHLFHDDQDLPEFATIKEDNGKLSLVHRNSLPVFEYQISSPSQYGEAARNAVSQLEKLARADQLLKLEPTTDFSLQTQLPSIDSSVVVELGRIHGRSRIPFKEEKPRITEQSPIYVKIENNNKSDTKLYASIFLVSGMGTIGWMSSGSPSGIELPTNAQPYIMGRVEHSGTIPGVKLPWAKNLSKDGPLQEAFIVILTDRKVDLAFLGTMYREEVVRREPPTEDDLEDDGGDDGIFFAVRRLPFEFYPK